MSASVHIVCPHCQAINCMPAAKLNDQPNSDQCQRPCSQASPSS